MRTHNDDIRADTSPRSAHGDAAATGESATATSGTPAPEHGDLPQIRWFLSLTPEQRLQTLQSFVDFVVEARNARAAGPVR